MRGHTPTFRVHGSEIKVSTPLAPEQTLKNREDMPPTGDEALLLAASFHGSLASDRILLKLRHNTRRRRQLSTTLRGFALTWPRKQSTLLSSLFLIRLRSIDEP